MSDTDKKHNKNKGVYNMGITDLEPPRAETEERLVDQNEAVTLPEMPELPADLNTKLDTFIEKLDLDQPGPAEFVLASALAATAESFGPSEAENLLSRFDEELTAQFFEQLIETGEIPQSPTMNNLLAGDVNSQAAQFILENLAAQGASGAFITMQATSRDGTRGGSAERKRRVDAASATYLQSLTGMDLYNHFDAELNGYRNRMKPQFVQDAEDIITAETDEEKAEIWQKRYEEVLEDINQDPQFADLTPEQRQQLAMMFTNEETKKALIEKFMERDPTLSRAQATELAMAEMQKIWEVMQSNPELAPTLAMQLQNLTTERDTLETLLASKETERAQLKADLEQQIETNKTEAMAITDPVEREIALLALDSTSCPTEQALAEQIREIMLKHGMPGDNPGSVDPEAPDSSDPFGTTLNYSDVDNARLRELMNTYKEWADKDAQELYTSFDVDSLTEQINELRAQIDELNTQIAALEGSELADSIILQQMRDQRDLYTDAQLELSQQLDALGDEAKATADHAEAVAAELEVAEAVANAAEAEMRTDEHETAVALSDSQAAAADLRAEGFGTIAFQHIANFVSPEHLPASLARFSEVGSEDVQTAIAEHAFLIERNGAGELFVSLGDGETLILSDEMKAHIQTAMSAGIEAAAAGSSFRTDTEAGGIAVAQFTAHNTELDQRITDLLQSEGNFSSAEEYLESVKGQAQEVMTILDGQRQRAAEYRQEIQELAADGKDTTAAQAQLNEIYSDIYRGNTALGIAQTNIATKLNLETPKFTFPTSLDQYTLSSGLGGDDSLTMPSFTTGLTFDLGATNPDFATVDFAAVDFTNMDFSQLDFSTFSTDLTTGSASSFYTPDYLAYDLSYDFYDYDFFDFDYDALDLTNFDFNDQFLLDTSTLLSSIDTGAIDNKLSNLQSDIDEIVQSVLATETLPEGVDREALEEAIRKDIEWNTTNQACRPIEESNVGKLLAAEGAESFEESMSAPGTSFMGMNLQGMFNGMSKLSENMAFAQAIAMEADQAAIDGRGERLVAAGKTLRERAAGEQGQAAGAESLTLEAPSVEEMTREAQLANEARVYADQVRANGIVTERDLEDAFPGLSADEMDLIKAEMEAEGIEVKLEEAVAGMEEPKPDETLTVADASSSMNNDKSPYEPAGMTMGA